MRLSPALAWRQPAYKVRGVGANLRGSNDQSMYQSSACSGVLYVARYLFLNILLGIPLTLKQKQKRRISLASSYINKRVIR
jgi:hypothetical protein